MSEEKPEKTVRYWATSTLLSKTVWVNIPAFIVGVLALPEVVAIIPVKYAAYTLTLSAIITLYLRQFKTVRPIAFIAPGETKPVDVPKVGPPPPGVTG